MLLCTFVKINIDKVRRHACAYHNTTLVRRRRSEHNIVVEEAVNDNKRWDTKDHTYRITDRQTIINDNDRPRDDIRHRYANSRKERKFIRKPLTNTEERMRKKHTSGIRNENSKGIESKAAKYSVAAKTKSTSPRMKESKTRSTDQVESKIIEISSEEPVNLGLVERDFTVYEIGNPELWYTVHVQLFEKLSTAEGKTVWNDLTDGEQASVGSVGPEWKNQDLSVRYRASEWISKEEFTLPTASLCLLAPVQNRNAKDLNDNSSSTENGGYIIMPKEDVMDLKVKDKVVQERDNVDGTDSVGNTEFKSNSSEQSEQKPRKVTLRTARALLRGSNSLNIAFRGAEKYLTLPHRRAHHAQLDVEARADENELVRVGATGRISIAVADSTRPTRTIITLQVGNTGLAAARFRVMAQDCGPALAELVSGKDKAAIIAGPELIPPRHTRSLRLELPVELPVDEARCSISLMNDEDKSIAVREVAIRKGDRCFCVWYCDCVCLGEDPKLLCRAMTDSRQLAAGLSLRDHARHARSVCYPDVITLNMCVIIIGVLLTLLFLGFLKACIGLICRCIATWGLDRLLQTPRKLDHYYESSLRDRPVEYDERGWPVHPDTKKRTVHLVSPLMEFFLNIILFICAPCIVVYEVLKQLCNRFLSSRGAELTSKSNKSNVKKCFSSQDIQGAEPRWRRRRGELRRWMTPDAHELSTQIWQKGLSPIKDDMRPLINKDHIHDGFSIAAQDSSVDSEQDDTEYVLTQMQKSRESIARTQRKMTEHGTIQSFKQH